jgi:hypothetical protein
MDRCQEKGCQNQASKLYRRDGSTVCTDHSRLLIQTELDEIYNNDEWLHGCIEVCKPIWKTGLYNIYEQWKAQIMHFNTKMLADLDSWYARMNEKYDEFLEGLNVDLKTKLISMNYLKAEFKNLILPQKINFPQIFSLGLEKFEGLNIEFPFIIEDEIAEGNQIRIYSKLVESVSITKHHAFIENDNCFIKVFNSDSPHSLFKYFGQESALFLNPSASKYFGKVYNNQIRGNSCLYFCEFYDRTLYEILESHERQFEEREIIETMLSVANAIALIKQYGLSVHNLSPKMIAFVRGGAKVVDFIYPCLDVEDKYCAPEFGRQRIKPSAAMVFALGMIALEMMGIGIEGNTRISRILGNLHDDLRIKPILRRMLEPVRDNRIKVDELISELNYLVS